MEDKKEMKKCVLNIDENAVKRGLISIGTGFLWKSLFKKLMKDGSATPNILGVISGVITFILSANLTEKTSEIYEHIQENIINRNKADEEDDLQSKALENAESEDRSKRVIVELVNSDGNETAIK